jgi:riboflavin synthase
MFSGIIRGIGTVKQIDDKVGLRSFVIAAPEEFTPDLELGASVAVDGVCLTVSSVQGADISFDVMAETLKRTTLQSLPVSGRVNLERSLREGSEIGGHPLSGHVDCLATIAEIEKPENNYVITFSVPQPYMKYIFNKGYVALNGASLTVTGADRTKNSFQVWLIPETLRLTTFSEKNVGAFINLEVERSTQVMVDTVRSFLEEKFHELGGDMGAMIKKMIPEK